ncbi:sodium-coupled monocarboxylate transporter 1-like [Mizuhopecten yessoensis]|uniref:sodium-coupled monocarboxylate transporter 1-like n=1 Tax=Mizuhopecten yessoensis TaxID=6573 RepID=UPI000B4571EA|nr:sodium-coupled monocarboxylate transporter 1-like [Mizuhopecten yessoensis]
MSAEFGFHVADYVIFAGMIAFSIGIGVYSACSGGGQKTTLEYLVGNRRLKMLPVAVSLVVSFESSILVLGFPAEAYIHGGDLLWTSVGLMVAMVVSSRVTAPLFHPLKLTSVFEYFELRYKSKAPRYLGTVIGMLYYIFYMGIVLYGPAIALEAVTDFPFWASVFIVAGTAIIYTSIGGLKAVVWTDVLQCIIMTIGMIVVIVKGTMDVGDVGKVFDINNENLRINYFNFDPDPTVRHTFWSLFVGSIIGYSGMAFNQATVQRISSVKTLEEAKKILYISGPVFFVFGIIVNIEGLVMFAYFNVIGCDPVEAGIIRNANQLLPHMVVRIFHGLPGLSGLFLASLFSASLSTLSSGLSCLSAQTVEDFLKPRYKDMSDRKATAIAKVSVIIYGGLSVTITALIANVSGSLSQVSSSILNCFAGPLAGLFFLSIFCPWATKKGFLIGGTSSMLFILWLSLGSNFFTSAPSQPWLPPNPTDNCFLDSTLLANTTSMTNASFLNNSMSVSLNDVASRIVIYQNEMDVFNSIEPQGIDKLYSVSFRWFGVIGVTMAIVIGALVSYVTGIPPKDEIDVRYILPLGDQLFPYLPKKARRWLEFGVDFEKRIRWLEKQDVETTYPTDLFGELNIELYEIKEFDTVSSGNGPNASHDIREFD